jgi:hypothetical protein
MSQRSPDARTTRRRTLDPRLLIGVLLVVASIAGVVGIVAANDDGVEVYAAPRLLTAGSAVSASDLELRRVSLGADLRSYLPAGSLPDEGVVVSRTVGAGELVPRSAVGDERGSDMTTIVVSLTSPLGGGVRAGDILDVWSSPKQEGGRFGAPAVISSDAQLMHVLADEGFAARGSGARVELLVLRRDVARILDALANGDALAVVPASLALEQ